MVDYRRAFVAGSTLKIIPFREEVFPCLQFLDSPVLTVTA
jgi:hypothetical protein